MVSGLLYKRQVRCDLLDLGRQNFHQREEFGNKGNCLKIEMTASGSTEYPVLNGIQVDFG